MAIIGYLGISASNYVAKLYEGNDEQYRAIALAATKISGEVKELEGTLIASLTLNSLINKDKFIQHHQLLLNQIQNIKKKLSFIPQKFELPKQLDTELKNIQQQGLFLIGIHTNRITNEEEFKFKNYTKQIRNFHDSCSYVRKLGVKIADENTLFLNRQKPITVATEVGSYAKRTEGHLMLFLTLGDPVDRTKFFKRHASLVQRLSELKKMTNQPDAGMLINKLEINVDKILHMGNYLLKTYDRDNKINTDFKIYKHIDSIKNFSSTASTIQKQSSQVMLYNFDWETLKTKTARSQAATIQSYIVALIIICISFAVFLGYVLYKSVTTPLKTLTAMSSEIGKGNIEVNSSFKTKDEFSELGLSFNHMCEALKSSRDEILLSKKTADKSNQAKTDFLSSMSHELRTPMNAILGFGQIMELDDTLTTEQKNNVREIMNGGNHLLQLINELLDLSNIEAGKLRCSLEDCELDDILLECFSLIEPLAEKREIKIYNDINSAFNYSINVDKTRFKQIILNLMSNAIKYNQDKGSVTLTSTVMNNNQLRITVSDTGNGLTEHELQLLFKPFERIEKHAGIEGSGIGLVICKRLVELMGGTIGVESQIGKGSRFWVQVNLS